MTRQDDDDRAIRDLIQAIEELPPRDGGGGDIELPPFDGVPMALADEIHILTAERNMLIAERTVAEERVHAANDVAEDAKTHYGKTKLRVADNRRKLHTLLDALLLLPREE